MVIDHHPVHHAGVVVAAVHAQYVPLDAVIEDAGRDLDLVLCLVDVVAEGVDLVVSDRYQVIGRIESQDADDCGGYEQRRHDPHERDASALDGDELVVLAHLSYGPHRCKQCGERHGQGQDRTSSPHQELEDDAEGQALVDQFVDIDPQELHHQYEHDDQEDRQERSYEGFEYEPVQSSHTGDAIRVLLSCGNVLEGVERGG